ncbi:MAG: alpha/beta hydrolase [Candidatus Nanopelagicales bacterium]
MEETATRVESVLDRGALELFSIGSGPGVVLVQGGGTDASVYRRLATRLASRFTVHSYNRRGRGRSAPRPDDYGLDTEIADLRSVLTQTGSARVIGHSVGGYFALAAARAVPAITRLALFDPAVSVDGAFPRDFLPEFERLVAAGETVDAMVVVGRGLNGSNLPGWLGRAAVRAMLLTPPGRTLGRLLPTVPAETRLALQGDGPANQWATVSATTRFYIGERSPDYYLPMARKLQAVMPDASVEIIPRLGHDAVARAGAKLVESLGHFLADD